MPWVFTESHPLDTSSFIDEAKKRGIELDLWMLRELYRHGLLIPFVELTYRPIREPSKPDGPEPIAGSSRLMEIRQARDAGCLRDLSTEPFKQRLPFERGRQESRRWWNGLIYSRYQLLALPTLEGLLDKRPYLMRGKYRLGRVSTPHPMTIDRMTHLHKVAVALTALEARYLPKLDPEFIQLNNADWEDWDAYRKQFDPIHMQEWLPYPAKQVLQDAEELLSHARRIDPVGADWSQLIRRAPVKARKYLKDAALQAMDLRIAAEILLLFYEDLAQHNKAEALPPIVERLSYRPGHSTRTLSPSAFRPILG